MTGMDLETVIMSEIHQTDKDTSYNITYVWNLKNGTKWIYFQNKSGVTDAEKSYCYQNENEGGER